MIFLNCGSYEKVTGAFISTAGKHIGIIRISSFNPNETAISMKSHLIYAYSPFNNIYSNIKFSVQVQVSFFFNKSETLF